MTTRKVIEEFIIPKCSSKAFMVKEGQVLRVIVHEGKQVVDMRVLNAHDYREQFSARVSTTLNALRGTGGIKKIEKLYSKLPWENVMMTVIYDKSGDHTLGAQCFPTMIKIIGQKSSPLSCADLFDECLKPYRLSMMDLDSCGVFNIFMPIRYLDDEYGSYEFMRPSCEKGDYIEFLAEMDVLIAATSCPNDNIINDFEPKAVKYQILG